MKSLSLIMIVRDEEEKLERCLNSAQPYVEEIVIVDTGSKDNSKKIASKYTNKVYDFEWDNDFSSARNFALDKSSSTWNLILDADEYIIEFDWDSIEKVMEQTNVIGRIQVESITEQNNETNEMINWIPRLLPSSARFYGRIHEQVDTSIPRQNIAIKVSHDGYLNVTKAERNLPLIDLEIKNAPEDPYWYYQAAKEYSGSQKHEKASVHYDKAIARLKGNERYAPNIIVDYIYMLLSDKNLNKAHDIISKAPDFVLNFSDYHFVKGIFYLDWIMSDPEKNISQLHLIEQSYNRCIELGESELYDSTKGTGSFAAWYNLGNYYEVTGQASKAEKCYQESAKLGYQKAILHLQHLKLS